MPAKSINNQLTNINSALENFEENLAYQYRRQSSNWKKVPVSCCTVTMGEAFDPLPKLIVVSSHAG